MSRTGGAPDNYYYHTSSVERFSEKFDSMIIRSILYHTQAIITRGLYTFYQLFEVHLCMVGIQERVIVALVRYIVSASYDHLTLQIFKIEVII